MPRRTGLVLGGGAVRGAAHIGVYSVLERAGIRPDVIAGTSVGAVIGASIAAGLTSEEMLTAFRAAKWTDLAKPSWSSKLSLVDTNPLGELVSTITGARTFDDLKIPFAAVASDILTGTSVAMTQGSLCDAVVASAAVPVLFEPVRLGEALLVDGGLTDNLPVDAARSLGADYIIAVDIMPPLDGSWEPADIRDVALISFTLVQRGRESGRDAADVVLTPDVVRIPLSDFSFSQQAFDAGVVAAQAALPAILRDLGYPGSQETGA